MVYSKFIYCIYFCYCYFSILSAFADDKFTKGEIEKEMLLNPPGIGNPSNAITVYSKRANTATKKIINTSNKKIQNNLINESDVGISDPYLKLNKDGIKVYIYKSKRSDFATFKAITHIDASIDSILAVILDLKSSTQWIDACKRALIIKKFSFTEQYHYQEFSVPFPFSNRDFILHSKMDHNPSTHEVTIVMSARPDYCQDKQSEQCNKVNQSSLVRVKKSIGTFKLQPDTEGTKITWIQHTDPGGHLPAWLVNQLVKNTPYQTFKNLAQKVKEDRYRFAKLIYDINGMVVGINKPDILQNISTQVKVNSEFF